MKQFDSYEIRQIFEEKSTCTPVTELTAYQEGNLIAGMGTVYWSLYGFRNGEGAEIIADRSEYADIRALYFAITGHDCGEESQCHFKLPLKAPNPPEYEERRQSIFALATEQLPCDERFEIDEDADFSEGEDNGAFIATWFWVDFGDTPLDKETLP